MRAANDRISTAFIPEALACGYATAALVTSVQDADRIKSNVSKNGLVLLGVDSKANVLKICPR